MAYRFSRYAYRVMRGLLAAVVYILLALMASASAQTQLPFDDPDNVWPDREVTGWNGTLSFKGYASKKYTLRGGELTLGQPRDELQKQQRYDLRYKPDGALFLETADCKSVLEYISGPELYTGQGPSTYRTTNRHPQATKDCDTLLDQQKIDTIIQLTPRDDDSLYVVMRVQKKLFKPNYQGAFDVTGTGVMRPVYKMGSRKRKSGRGTKLEQAQRKTGEDWLGGIHLKPLRAIIAEADEECANPVAVRERRERNYRSSETPFIPGYALTGLPNMIGWDYQSEYMLAKIYPDACFRAQKARECLTVDPNDAEAMCDCAAGYVGKTRTGVGATNKVLSNVNTSAVAVDACTKAIANGRSQDRARYYAQLGRGAFYGTEEVFISYSKATENYQKAIDQGFRYAHFSLAWLNMEIFSGGSMATERAFREYMNKIADHLYEARTVDLQLAELLAKRHRQFIKSAEQTSAFAKALLEEMYKQPDAGSDCGAQAFRVGNDCMVPRGNRPGYLD